jgi:hypothetical protein
MNGTRVASEDKMLGTNLRVRDVRSNAAGDIFLVLDDRGGAKTSVVRFELVNEKATRRQARRREARGRGRKPLDPGLPAFGAFVIGPASCILPKFRTLRPRASCRGSSAGRAHD